MFLKFSSVQFCRFSFINNLLLVIYLVVVAMVKSKAFCHHFLNGQISLDVTINIKDPLLAKMINTLIENTTYNTMEPL